MTRQDFSKNTSTQTVGILSNKVNKKNLKAMDNLNRILTDEESVISVIALTKPVVCTHKEKLSDFVVRLVGLSHDEILAFRKSLGFDSLFFIRNDSSVALEMQNILSPGIYWEWQKTSKGETHFYAFQER